MKEEKKEESPRNEEGVSGSKFQGSGNSEHGECCEECRRTCRRNFWTEVLRTIVKVGTAVMAAFGLSSFVGEET